MKNLVKILALFALVIIIFATFRSILKSQAANSSPCPGPGNNVIDNITPDTLQHLREDATSVPADCQITATFLMRKYDFQNSEKLQAFFAAAEKYNILPIIRVASDNNGDNWQAISPQEAALDATMLRQASSVYNGNFYASFGNEVNLNNEWGGHADANSYAESLIAFANAASGSNIKVLIAPLSQAAGISAQTYYQDLFQALLVKIGYKSCGCGSNLSESECQIQTDCDPRQKTVDWIKTHIDGYALNLYDHGTGDSSFIITDANNILSYLSAAGFPLDGMEFVVTELGVCNGGNCGIYRPDAGSKSCQYFSDLKARANHGSQFILATIFARSSDGKVNSFYFSNGCNSAQEYNKAKINLGGSTSYGSPVATPNSDIPSYPPLGSLEACPPEITINSETNIPRITTSPSNQTWSGCSKLQPTAEPAECAQIKTQGACSITYGIRRWCDPATCAQGGSINNSCASNPGGDGKCGQGIDGFCNKGWIPANWSQILKASCDQASDDSWKLFSQCLAHYQKSGSAPSGANTPLPSNSQLEAQTQVAIPACIPTYNAAAHCVSECGEPVNFNEQLTFQLQSDCVKSGNCYAQLGIKDKDGKGQFYLPFAAKLGDYFAGILDAEHLPPAELDRMQNILRAGSTDPSQNVQEVFNAAGVDRKLLPKDIQDQLKCNFITDIKSRKANGQNTKYMDFKVYDLLMTDIPCPPKLSDFANTLSEYQAAYSSWQNKYSKYWFGVPLFSNDDAQGKIVFTSPSLFSTFSNSSLTKQQPAFDTTGKQVQFGPVYVSIPEIQRLSLATNILQGALIPKSNIDLRNKQISNPDPAVLQKFLPTYGKTIDPKSFINACAPQKWENFYNKTDQIIYDASKNYRLGPSDLNNPDYQPVVPGTDASGSTLTEYSRAVTCNITTLPGEPDSTICSVGPYGELRCSQQDKSGSSLQANTTKNFAEVVQTRSVFPYLFDIAEQTIEKSTGLLRIFEPNAKDSNPANTLNQGINNTAAGPANGNLFEKNFDPIPASIDNVRYYLPTSNGLAIDDTGHQENGWKVFFYKLGGLWNARNFVLQLLYPHTASVPSAQ